MLTNDDWVAGFQLLMIVLLVIGVLILVSHSIQVDHQNCIQHGGQWVHGLSTNGDRVYYCIEPAGL
jgi:competence protein ComGC